jgi:hypothetical protein
LQAGLAGRLLDYYPKVEFMVWRRDRCPEGEPEFPPKNLKDEKQIVYAFKEQQANPTQTKEELQKAVEKDMEMDEEGRPILTDDEIRAEFAVILQGQLNPDRWLVQDRLWISKSMHVEAKKTLLIDNEAFLQGWGEKLFASDDTRKLWKKGLRKRKLSVGCQSS